MNSNWWNLLVIDMKLLMHVNIIKLLLLKLSYWLLILITWFDQVIYVIIRMLIFHSSFTWKHWIGLVVTSLAYYFPYQQLARMAKPSYTQDGDLLDGGFDMNTGGVCGYGSVLSSLVVFVKISISTCGKRDFNRYNSNRVV